MSESMEAIAFQVKGHTTIMDADDYEKFGSMKLTIRLGWSKIPYVTVRINKKIISLHRIIINAPDGMLVDHANRNSLDNRKCNLRLATRSQNMGNRISRIGASKYKGVHWRPSMSKWRAQITAGAKGDKQLKLGNFDTEDEAALAYNAAALEKWGEYAFLNEVNHGK